MPKRARTHRIPTLKKGPQLCDRDIKYLSLTEGYWSCSTVYSYIEGTPGNQEDDSDGCSIASYSTNATVDNNLGAGRVLGRLYLHLGGKLERAAVRLGFVNPRPAQILSYFMRKYPGRWLGFPSDRVLGEEIERFSDYDVAGLKSLVKQTQSNSVYRSAAALAALIQLSTAISTNRTFIYLSNFYSAVARTENIYHLKRLADSLDDSQEEKTNLLVLVRLASDRDIFLTKHFSECEPCCPSSWRAELLAILDQYQRSKQDLPFVAIAKACHLYAQIENSMHHRACDSTTHVERTERMVIEIAYFTTIFLMLAITTPYHSSSHTLSNLEHLLLSTIACYVDAMMESILDSCDSISLRMGLVEYSGLLFGALHASPELEKWFPSAYSLYWKKDHFPRRIRRLGVWHTSIPPILQSYIRNWMLRSRRLFLFLGDLEREARESMRGLDRVLSRYEHSDIPNIEWMEEKLTRSLDRARRARIEENDSMREFLSARNHPGGQGGKAYEWSRYKRNCQLRHRWGELLRSNLDWDWDVSASLRRLFRFKKREDRTNRTWGVPEISDVMDRDSPPEEIRLAFKTETGEVKYKLYRACSSVEDIVVCPHSQTGPDQKRKMVQSKLLVQKSEN